MRKLLFISGIVIMWLLAWSYFYTKIAVGIMAGTLILTFITKIVGNPKASLQNSFFVSSGWVAISFFAANLPETEATIIIALVAYMALIKKVYNSKKLLPVMMLAFLSIIFRKSISIVWLDPLTDITISALFRYSPM